MASVSGGRGCRKMLATAGAGWRRRRFASGRRLIVCWGRDELGFGRSLRAVILPRIAIKHCLQIRTISVLQQNGIGQPKVQSCRNSAAE